MRSLQLLSVLTFALSCFMLGCDSSDGPTAVADEDGIAAYVAANPDSGDDLEPEGGTDE
ncbi:MAG: hypothetical protein ACR2NZ_16415 [Rubripirellula sp.]